MLCRLPAAWPRPHRSSMRLCPKSSFSRRPATWASGRSSTTSESAGGSRCGPSTSPRLSRLWPAAESADLVWLESPTNPTLDVADLAAICSALTARGIPTVVDSTFATPLGQRPLDLGATVVLHSATKFIGGHSDLLLGVTVVRDAAIFDSLFHARTYTGATPGSLEAFLALRGLRTLPLRFEAASRSAVELAGPTAFAPGGGRRASDWPDDGSHRPWRRRGRRRGVFVRPADGPGDQPRGSGDHARAASEVRRRRTRQPGPAAGQRRYRRRRGPLVRLRSSTRRSDALRPGNRTRHRLPPVEASRASRADRPAQNCRKGD